MDNTVQLVTAVPIELALQLTKTKRIQDYNVLGQIHPKAIKRIKENLGKKVGYENLPIACLSKVECVDSTIKSVGESINHYLPVKAHNSVILQLKMPKDSMLSMEYNDLLEYSNDLADADGDPEEEEFILGLIDDALQQGVASDLKTAISFIAFLDLEKCQFFATLNSAFRAEKLELEGVEQIDLRKLSTFK